MLIQPLDYDVLTVTSPNNSTYLRKKNLRIHGVGAKRFFRYP
jgi:hypothetical protein